MKSLKIAGLSVLLIAAAAYAADGIVLKQTWKKGEVSKTRVKGTLDFGGQELSVNMLNQEKVVDVAADGTVTLEQSVLSLLVNIGGTEQDMAGQNSATVVLMNADGTVKEIRGENVDAAMYRVTNLMSFRPPAEPLKVGYKWTLAEKANSSTGAVAFKVESEVVADEKVGKWDTLKIKYKVIETEGSDPASVDGTVWLSKSDASQVKSDVVWTNVPMAAAPMPISGKFTSMREE